MTDPRRVSDSTNYSGRDDLAGAAAWAPARRGLAAPSYRAAGGSLRLLNALQERPDTGTAAAAKGVPNGAVVRNRCLAAMLYLCQKGHKVNPG